MQHGKLKYKNSRTTRDEAATAFRGSDTLPDEILELKTPHELFAAFLSQ
jgi:hypothetical protein